MRFRIILAGLTTLFLLLASVSEVSAHSTQPRVEISTERLKPGEVLDVRGVSFDMDEPVTLALLGTGVEIPLGEVLSNGEGEFLQIVVLPSDLAEGTYYFRATTTHHWVISPPLTVWGSATVEGGGQGPREAEDGLLAPMPTADRSVPVLQPTPVVPVQTQENAKASWNINWSLITLLMALILISGVALRRKVFQ